MWKRYTFKCNKCAYEVMTSGGYDYGMLAVTDTYICSTCKKIVDVTFGEYGKTYNIGEVLQKKNNSKTDLNFYTCPDCGSETNLIKWSDIKRPCPRCDGIMEMDYFGETLLWD
jgi:Zn finger protein HypA/HybF involved in hydrogenase expression